MEFIYKTQKKEILEKLEWYGITELPYLMSISGKEKVRGYSGSFSDHELRELDKDIGVELLGLYLFHIYNDEIRLSFDGMLMLKDQITKNIIEVNEKQAKEFFQGQDIALEKEDKEKWKNEPTGFKVIKFKDEFIGTGKLTNDRIVNYLPKERRIKSKG